MAIPVNKLTKFRVSRGSVGNNRFSSFTYVGVCTKEKCPIEVCILQLLMILAMYFAAIRYFFGSITGA